MKNLGILIIDMQPKFLHLDEEEHIELVGNHLDLIEHAKEKEVPIFVMEYINQDKTIDELRIPLEQSNAVFIEKYNDNAFIKLTDPYGEYVYNTNPGTIFDLFAGKGFNYNNYLEESKLDKKLRERRIKKIILTGVNKYGCVIRTAEEAKKRGYNLITSKPLLNQKHAFMPEGEKWYKTNSIYFGSLKNILDFIDFD
jgi:nicotinamidase-related amidase